MSASTLDLARRGFPIVPGPRAGVLEGVATPRDLATIAQHLKRAHRGARIHEGDIACTIPADFEANVPPLTPNPSY